MATGAVLIVGVSRSAQTVPPAVFPEAPESLSGCPLPCLEILGRSMLARTIETLRDAGVCPITLVGTEDIAQRTGVLPGDAEICLARGREDALRMAARKMDEHFAGGVRTVLLQKLGAYVEYNLADMLQFHEGLASTICRSADAEGPLDLWLVEEEMASLAGPNLDWESQHAHWYRGCQYVNRLRSVRELRRLVVDVLHSRCAIKPTGTEVRSGVWMDEQAHVHREARVVSPAYIGRCAKVQASALITRSSSLERDCEVGEATVVEDSTILPDTNLGRWLDVSHAVVDGNTFVDLRSEVAVEIADSALVGRAKSSETGMWQGGEHLKFVKRVSGRMKALLH
jgi:hypothetical protein